MNIIWLGHGGFRIEIGDQILLIDPWLEGNPMMEGQDHSAATQGATHILITHGHFDHTGGLVELSKSLNVPVSGIVELANLLFGQGAVEGHAYNLGGAIALGTVKAHLVPASHSSTIPGNWLRPRTPPKAVPRQLRPVTSWKGRVPISCPAPATPMMMLSPQPL